MAILAWRSFLFEGAENASTYHRVRRLTERLTAGYAVLWPVTPTGWGTVWIVLTIAYPRLWYWLLYISMRLPTFTPRQDGSPQFQLPNVTLHRSLWEMKIVIEFVGLKMLSNELKVVAVNRESLKRRCLLSCSCISSTVDLGHRVVSSLHYKKQLTETLPVVLLWCSNNQVASLLFENQSRCTPCLNNHGHENLCSELINKATEIGDAQLQSKL